MPTGVGGFISFHIAQQYFTTASAVISYLPVGKYFMNLLFTFRFFSVVMLPRTAGRILHNGIGRYFIFAGRQIFHEPALFALLYVFPAAWYDRPEKEALI